MEKMTVDEITRKMWVESPNEWRFICGKLSKEEVEKIVADNIPEPDLKDEFFPEEPLPDVNFLQILMRAASKKMWEGFEYKHIYNLLVAMKALKIESVKMEDLEDYTAEHIMEEWSSIHPEQTIDI